jgi:cell division protein FtsN
MEPRLRTSALDIRWPEGCGNQQAGTPKKAAKADPTSKAQAPLAKPTSEKWTLQAGAFESKKKADVLASELEKETDARGPPVPEVVTVKVRGKTMYRVQVGIYDSRELAKAALDAWAQGHPPGNRRLSTGPGRRRTMTRISARRS